MSKGRQINSVCVYCGSSDRVDGAYLAEAHKMGSAIARRGMRLIFGGGCTGLMGAVADAAAAADAAADADETTLRLSVDAKGTILLGLLARGGYNRVVVKALDHDFRPDKRVTPVGVFLPQYNELYIFLTTGPLSNTFLTSSPIVLNSPWMPAK